MGLLTDIVICTTVIITTMFVIYASDVTNTTSLSLALAKIEMIIAISYMIFSFLTRAFGMTAMGDI